MLLGLVGAASLIAGCQARVFDATAIEGHGGAGGKTDGGGAQDAAPTFDLNIGPGDAPQSTEAGDGPSTCVRLTCAMAGGQYCGKIGDGCGGTLECGACPDGQICGGSGTDHVCAKVDPNCVPVTCAQTGGRYCGKVGDGCGKVLDCGACPGNETCGAVTAQVCGTVDPNCKPLTCAQMGGRYCGKIGDGCGGSLDCGACVAGTTCGGDNTPNVCGTPTNTTCVPLTCDSAGGRFCGTIGDGCGKTLNCGDCPAGTTCGGAGTPSVCAKVPPANCDPLVCDQPGGKYCGLVGDGCNKTIDCGGCPTGQTCGGGGTPGLCGAPGPAVCQPLTCQQPGGSYCGSIGDGCGKTIDCGGCPAGDTCGGGGTPNVCGRAGTTCQAIACQQATGQYCGKIGDGCGKTIDCGACPAGATCGAGGIAGVCARPTTSCQPLACVQTGGQYCGVVGDGCGKAMDCGACPAGQTCGGAGTPGVCGVPPSSTCTPIACTQPSGKYCGMVGDGCGRTIDCAGCSAGQTCGGGGIPGVCGAPPPAGCMALTCQASASLRYCGTIGDGCGSSLSCTACPAGQTCGGGGVAGLCGAPPPAGCVPLTCTNGSVQYCGGTIGNGCGGSLACTAACPAGQSCGGGGVPGVCGAPPPAGCVALTSCTSGSRPVLWRHHREWLRRQPQLRRGLPGGADLRWRRRRRGVRRPAAGRLRGADQLHQRVGPVLRRGDRQRLRWQPQLLGGLPGGADLWWRRGRGRVRGAAAGRLHGPDQLHQRHRSSIVAAPSANGCGGSLNCSAACPSGQTCGGGGVSGVCGAPPPAGCVPAVCRPASGGQYCGTIGDGCGGTLNCGACDAGNTCAGNGVANVCFPDSCVNLCRQQVTCPASGDTTITGIVRAGTPPQFGPADPIYNAIVYVPNATVAALPGRRLLRPCGTPALGVAAGQRPHRRRRIVHPAQRAGGHQHPAGHPGWAVAPPDRDPDGHRLRQHGADREQTRLPRNKTEGDIPLTAVATGNVDTLECVLRKMGIADSEFTTPAGTGRVHMYRVNGASAPGGTNTSYSHPGRQPHHPRQLRHGGVPLRGGRERQDDHPQTERHQLRQRGRAAVLHPLQLRLAVQHRAVQRDGELGSRPRST